MKGRLQGKFFSAISIIKKLLPQSDAANWEDKSQRSKKRRKRERKERERGWGGAGDSLRETNLVL